MVTGAPQFFFKALNLAERVLARAQGKGYGSATIRQEVSILQSFLTSPPRLAIDIGGNVGNYTAELRRRNADLEIHVFEPSATNIEKIRVRFAADTNITLVSCAVSDDAGAATLFSNLPGSGLGSLTQRKLDHLNIPFDTRETVQTIRFEDYWTENLGRRSIDLVKIDIEGHELGALNGFGDALKETAAVQFEFGGCNIDTNTYFQQFWYYFHERNFALYRITPFGAEEISKYRESDEFFSTTNYIAVNRA